jgi:lysophospholipid acyltransferase
MDYLSYQLFFPTLMVGPTFTYELYLTFSRNRDTNVRLPLNLLTLLQPLFIALPIAALTLTYMPTFPSTWVLTDPFYLSLPLWQKSLLLIPVGFLYRAKYYAAWYLGQTCANLSTLSQTTTGDYNAISTVSIKF